MADSPDPLIERLIRRLDAGDSVDRRNTAGALRLHGRRAAAAVPALTRLLADDDDRVRNEAQRALDRIRRAAG
jgi:hypothetical protein